MSSKKRRDFVKSADTDVPVEKSIEDIKTLVRRNGAAGFGVQEDYRTGRVMLSFVLNTSEGGHMPIQIPLDIQKVHEKMYAGRQPNQFTNNEEHAQKRRDQAERTAWRQLFLIVDALLTANALGIMTLADAFLGHVVVVNDEGRSERMADYVARTQGVLAPGVRALLAAAS
jgi:hypothetical protein